MAPTPKKRQTKGSQQARRQQIKLALPNLSACPVCGKPKQSHRVCLYCGNYKKSQ